MTTPDRQNGHFGGLLTEPVPAADQPPVQRVVEVVRRRPAGAYVELTFAGTSA